MDLHHPLFDHHATSSSQVDALLADTGLQTLRAQLAASNRPDLQRAFDAMANALLAAHGSQPSQARVSTDQRPGRQAARPTGFDRVFRPLLARIG